MNEKWGPVLLLGVGFLALFLFTRKGTARPAACSAGSCKPAPYWVAERVSEESHITEPVKSDVLYQNEEKIHFELNADGIPTDIVIHRTITRG